MRLSTTIVLAAIALALGSYIWVTESPLSENERLTLDSRQGHALLGFDPDTIGAVDIEDRAATTRLERSDVHWRLTQPLNDRADATLVESLLRQLADMRVIDEIRPDEIRERPDLDEGKLGFDGENRIRVILHPDAETEGPSLELEFGSPAALQDAIYARRPNHSESTYVVEGNPRPLLAAPEASLRDRALLGITPDQVGAITLRTQEGVVEIARMGAPAGGWRLLQPLEARANEGVIETLLSRLAALQVTGILEETDADSPIRSDMPTGAARLDLSIAGRDEPLIVYLAPHPDHPAPGESQPAAPRLSARVSDRPSTFELRSSLLNDLHASSKSFRDPALLRVPPAYLHSIVIQSRANPDVILMGEPAADGVRWYSLRNDQKERASNERLQSLIDAVNGNQILDYLESTPSTIDETGLAEPELRLVFNLYLPGEDGRPVIGPDGEPELVPRVLSLGRPDEERLFAAVNGEDWIYAVNPALRSSLPTHPLKWRQRKVLNFNLINLSRIVRQRGEDPPLKLDYDYAQDRWSASVGDENADDRLQPRQALSLARTLGSLTAADWVIARQIAYEALETPSAVITFQIDRIDRATNDRTTQNHRLELAPAATGLYYGRLDEDPDVFLLSRETYRDLVQPVIGAASPEAGGAGQPVP